MYDVIVVGARCAGSPTDMLLARKGYRVLLVDKATFPSDTISTHLIHVRGVASLKRWGILDQVISTNSPALEKYTFDFGPFALRGEALPIDGVAAAYAPRRYLIDNVLVAAASAGAQVRQGFSVKALVMEGERVMGIRGRSAQGETVTEKAPLVIGADGMRSFVARAVQAPTYNVKPDLTCSYYSYWSGVPVEGIELYPRNRRVIGASATNDGKTLVAVQWPHEEFHKVRSDIATHFLQTLEELTPQLAQRLRQGKREERFNGSGDLPNFFRRAFGPGWALVGDAGHFKDPALAHGMSDAFHDAELLSEAVARGLSGEEPMLEALARYEQERDAYALPLYEMNSQMATLEPPAPETQRMFMEGAGNANHPVRIVPSGLRNHFGESDPRRTAHSCDLNLCVLALSAVLKPHA